MNSHFANFIYYDCKAKNKIKMQNGFEGLFKYYVKLTST